MYASHLCSLRSFPLRRPEKHAAHCLQQKGPGRIYPLALPYPFSPGLPLIAVPPCDTSSIARNKNSLTLAKPSPEIVYEKKKGGGGCIGKRRGG